jgi:hypothetical protein
VIFIKSYFMPAAFNVMAILSLMIIVSSNSILH